MKRSTLHSIILIIAILCILTVGYSVYMILTRPFDVRTIEVRFEVGETIGIEINKTALTFGRVLTGVTAQRSISLDNPYPYAVHVRMFADPFLASYLTTPEDRFTIEPQSSYNATFNLLVPVGTPLGSYSGTLRLEFRR